MTCTTTFAWFLVAGRHIQHVAEEFFGELHAPCMGYCPGVPHQPYEMMTLHCPPSSSGQVLWWQERRRTEGYCGRAGLPRCVRCATIRRGWTPALLQTVHGEAGLRVSGRKIALEGAHHYVASVWHMGVVAFSNCPKTVILTLPRGVSVLLDYFSCSMTTAPMCLPLP